MRPRPGTRRRLLALSAVVLLAAGCTDEDPEDAGTSAAVASPSPSPTPSPVTTEPPDEPEEPEETPVVSDEPPPELELVGDDYEQVVRSYTTYRTWLFRNPDPERFDDITHPDCECYIQKDLIAHYQDEGLRWTGGDEGVQVLDVQIIDDQARHLVHLEVIFERLDSGELIDADGEVHEVVEPKDPWIEELVFVRDNVSAPWRLLEFLERGFVEGASDG